MVRGGDSGPAAVAGKPEESLLIESVKYKSYEMPHEKKLTDREIGMPPTPLEVVGFEAAAAVDREGAISSLIDELLSSPL